MPIIQGSVISVCFPQVLVSVVVDLGIELCGSLTELVHPEGNEVIPELNGIVSESTFKVCVLVGIILGVEYRGEVHAHINERRGRNRGVGIIIVGDVHIYPTVDSFTLPEEEYCQTWYSLTYFGELPYLATHLS